MLQSVSQLSELTGKTRETIQKRLNAAAIEATPGAKMAKLYETKTALPAIYEAPQGGDQGELMRARCRNLDLDSQLKKQRLAIADGSLLPADIVCRVWSGMTGAATQRLLGLPYRLAVNCERADFATIQSQATALIYEALDCIHAYNPEDYMIDPAALVAESEPPAE